LSEAWRQLRRAIPGPLASYGHRRDGRSGRRSSPDPIESMGCCCRGCHRVSAGDPPGVPGRAGPGRRHRWGAPEVQFGKSGSNWDEPSPSPIRPCQSELVQQRSSFSGGNAGCAIGAAYFRAAPSVAGLPAETTARIRHGISAFRFLSTDEPKFDLSNYIASLRLGLDFGRIIEPETARGPGGMAPSKQTRRRDRPGSRGARKLGAGQHGESAGRQIRRRMARCGEITRCYAPAHSWRTSMGLGRRSGGTPALA
jgi:hypothetical protein